MEILHVTKKGNMTNNLEIFYKYNVTRHDDQINEKDTVQHSVIFDTLIQNNPHTNSLYNIDLLQSHTRAQAANTQ
jgi:hypothetical protein